MADAPATQRLPRLDGLRGLCILLVLAGHALQFRGGHSVLGAVLAGFGVQCFFALSGFVITRLLLEEEARRGGICLRHFYLRRLLRLFPALAVLLAAVAGLILAGHVTDESWRSWLISAAYLRNIGGSGTTLAHLWSLALEEQFYLLWPLLLGWFAPRRRLAWVLGAVAAVVVVRTVGIVLALQPPESGVFYLRPWYRADALLVGAGVALAGAERWTPQPWVVWMLVLCVPAGLWGVERLPAGLHGTWMTTAHGLLSVALLVGALWAPGALRSGLGSPLARWLGTLSYSLYLWQQLFLVTGQPSWGWARELPWAIACTVAAGWLSYAFIERPVLRWRDRVFPAPR